MKITSRPDQEDDQPIIIGGSQYVLNLDEAQMELIAALVYQCRLGASTIYSQAAFELNDMFEQVMGIDFMDDAATAVDLHVTAEDDTGGIVFSTKSGSYYPTLEV